jgi:hypothetical protein
VTNMKKCPACGRTLVGNRKYCADDSCQKAATAARKARQRARAQRPDPGPTRAPVDTPVGYVSPWGIAYDSEAEAWADCLLTGGLHGGLTEGERMHRHERMRGRAS